MQLNSSLNKKLLLQLAVFSLISCLIPSGIAFAEETTSKDKQQQPDKKVVPNSENPDNTPEPEDNDLKNVLDNVHDNVLNNGVSVATKTESNVDNIPDIVEVITEKKIKQRGYRTLADVLMNLTYNEEQFRDWAVGEPVHQNAGFGFRFDTNQNILIMFNGQRLNAFILGNRFPYEEYLLDNIEKIEIIKGPGSALYGANAVTAVVNIISKSDTKTEGKNDYKLGILGNATALGKGLNGAWQTKLGENSFFSGAFRVADEFGQSILVKDSLMGDTVMRDGIDHAIDGDMFFTFDKFRAYLKIDNQKRKPFTGFSAINPPDINQLNVGMYAYSLGADYSLDLTEKLKIKASLGGHQDNFTEIARVPNFKVNDKGDQLIKDKDGLPILDPVKVVRDGKEIETPFLIDGQSVNTRTLDGEVQFTLNYLEKNNLVFGINASNDQVLNADRMSEIQLEPFKIGPFREFTDAANNWLYDTSAARNTLGGYAQIDYNLGNFLFFNGGARLDWYSGTGKLSGENYAEFNPRAGLVYKNDIIGNIKLAYGKATRVPNMYEALSSFPLIGSPSRRPERINMVQGQWLKNWNTDVRTELGGFYANIYNHLQTDTNITESDKAKGFIGQLVNLDNRVFQSSGVDGSVNFQLFGLNAELNATEYLYTNDGTNKEIPYIPKFMLNGNINVPVYWANFNLGVNYRGQWTWPQDDKRVPVSPYASVNLSVNATPPWLPVEVQLGAANLFNTAIHYPSSSQDFPESFPARGIDLWGRINYLF